MSITESDVHNFLNAYADALSTGDLNAITDAWHVPSLAVSPAQSVAITEPKQVAAFFQNAISQYKKAGVASVHLLGAHPGKDNTGAVAVNVVWQNTDGDGNTLGTENGFYVLSRSQDGKLGISLFSHA
jgi:ketosteroid isomerase-like protein